MKRILAFLLALAMLAAICCIPALAENEKYINVVMSTPDVDFQDASVYPTDADLDAAVEANSDLVTGELTFVPGRLTLLGTGHISCPEEVYDVTFQLWSTGGRTIGLFFLPDDGEQWELISCNLGIIIEGRFETAGTYAIAVGW